MAFVIRGSTRLYFTGIGGQTKRIKEKITAEVKALYLEKSHEPLRSHWQKADRMNSG